jgi:hypothetical protein
MRKFIAVALLVCGCASYNKALVKCERKCLPRKVTRVEYNYANNRYDVCICQELGEMKPLTQEEYNE